MIYQLTHSPNKLFLFQRLYLNEEYTLLWKKLNGNLKKQETHGTHPSPEKQFQSMNTIVQAIIAP